MKLITQMFGVEEGRRIYCEEKEIDLQDCGLVSPMLWMSTAENLEVAECHTICKLETQKLTTFFTLFQLVH